MIQIRIHRAASLLEALTAILTHHKKTQSGFVLQVIEEDDQRNMFNKCVFGDGKNAVGDDAMEAEAIAHYEAGLPVETFIVGVPNPGGIIGTIVILGEKDGNVKTAFYSTNIVIGGKRGEPLPGSTLVQ